MTKPIFSLLIATGLSIALPLGAYTAGSGFTSTVLASNVNDYTFTQFEGLSIHGDTLYTGNFRSVKQYNLNTGNFSDYGSLPGNNGISHVTYAGSQVYASHFTSYAPPYPYNFGRVSEGGEFSQLMTMGGIFDADVSPSGELYFVANPDIDADNNGDGSRLFRFDMNTENVAEVAYLGGTSGGIAFDDSGNLYYSHYDDGAVYSYTALDLATGGLDLDDADYALTLEYGGYLDIDDNGYLLASQLDQDTLEQSISRYDLSSGNVVETLFTGNSSNFVHDGDTTYVIVQNWEFSGDYGSELIAVTPVPEPATYAAALGLLSGLLVWYRKRIKPASGRSHL